MFNENFYLSEVFSKASYVRVADGYPMFTLIFHRVKRVEQWRSRSGVGVYVTTHLQIHEIESCVTVVVVVDSRLPKSAS